MASLTPQNRVGHKVLTAAEVEQLLLAIRLIRSITAELGPTLNPDERKRLLNPRTGSEVMHTVVLRLAEARVLSTDAHRPSDVRADLSLAAVLLPVFQELEEAYHAMWDIVRLANSEAWSGTVSFYSALAALSKRDAGLALALRPAVEFMAKSPRSKAGAGATLPAVGGSEG